MFGSIGGFELLVLVAIGLLVFGPRRLPEIGRTLGRTIAELRKTAMEVKTTIEKEIDMEGVKEVTQSISRSFEGEIAPERSPTPPQPTAAAGTVGQEGSGTTPAGGADSGSKTD